MTIIPVFADTLSMKELKEAISQYSDETIPLTVMDNPDKFRSPLSDPTILGAIIQTGGTVLATLISVLVTIYITRKKDNKTEGGGNIIINIQLNDEAAAKLSKAKIVIPLDDFKAKAHQDEILELELHPERIVDISYVEAS
jgi:hypothetical protein